MLRRAGGGRAVDAHRATELEVDPRYDPCEPGYAVVRRGAVPRLLRRPRSLRRAHRAGGRTATEAIGATASPPTSTASSRAAGSRRRSRSPRNRSPPPATLGNPYWISYALWIAGMAFSKADVRRAFAALGRGRRLRARAPRAVLRRLPRARRGSPAHVRRRARGRAGAVRRRHRRVPAGRQRAAADHHAGQRARAVRAPRPSRSRRRCCSARCRASRRASTTCPSSASSATGSPPGSGRDAPRELTSAGAALDLNDAARLRAAADRRRPPRARRRSAARRGPAA